MSGNTCGCRMSRTYRWAVMVPHNTKGDLLLQGMATHTITPAVRVVCRCKANTGLKRLPRGHHTRIRLSSLLILNLDSSLKTTWFNSTAIQFPRARLHSKRRRRWGSSGAYVMGIAIPNDLPSRAFV
ncbi:uncharacterized protein TNCV_2530241 [Trichonephila clavipes]|nr:uncharacterized protein TNCV_2530241 [Trichonephila clavipes]